MSTKELSIKLLIDTKAHKVCFVEEAGGDALEFLSGLLSLPLGTVANLLTKERMAGTIGNVLDSVENLDANYKPRSPACSSCWLPTSTTATATTIATSSHVAMGPSYKRLMILGDTNGTEVVPMTTTYTIKDDLSVTPASNLLSGITLLAQCGVKDVSALQEKTVKIGKEEALAILVASLKSKTVLTDVFLPKKNARCKKREPPEEIS
ncbi:hypothetical protein ACQ4PT_002945 [Festuca glaucescens]